MKRNTAIILTLLVAISTCSAVMFILEQSEVATKAPLYQVGKFYYIEFDGEPSAIEILSIRHDEKYHDWCYRINFIKGVNGPLENFEAPEGQIVMFDPELMLDTGVAPEVNP
jgi:hypothetical protein